MITLRGGDELLLDFLLENHSLYALFKLHWAIFIGLIILLYIVKVIRSPLYEVSGNQILYFFTAMITLFIIKATPVDVIGTHYLFSVHTLQMSLTYFLVLPLVILSIPTGLLRQYVWHHQTKLIVTLLSHPWMSLITFNGLLSIYFIPTVFKMIHTSIIATIIVQVILLISAIFMWFVIINPLPEIKGLSYILRAFYIFLASVILMPIGFFYVVVQAEHFPMYEAVAGTILPGFTAVYDQQAAGGILKISQLASYSCALLIIAFKWGRQEEEREGQVDEENIRYARGVVIHLDKNRPRR